MNKLQQQANSTKHFWNFTQVSPSESELLLYGNIADETWWGDEVTPKIFGDELEAAIAAGAKTITVRINSGGGDVFAANAIYTRLKTCGAKIKCIIDGWAASAATIVAMAADTILIPGNGAFMIHNPKAPVMAYLEAKDARKLANTLDTIKKTIVYAYTTKTGKDEKEVNKLMDDETWYTGEEAVDAGFCDVLLFEADKAPENILNGGFMVVNSVTMDAANVPEKIKTLFKAKQPVNKNKKNEEVKEMSFKNLEELQAAYPELFAQAGAAAAAEAVNTERQRIADITANTLAGYENQAQEAIKNGTTFSDYSANLVKAIAAAKPAATKEPGALDYQAAALEDAEKSGVQNVVASVSPGKVTEEQAFAAILDSVLPAKK